MEDPWLRLGTPRPGICSLTGSGGYRPGWVQVRGRSPRGSLGALSLRQLRSVSTSPR